MQNLCYIATITIVTAECWCHSMKGGMTSAITISNSTQRAILGIAARMYIIIMYLTDIGLPVNNLKLNSDRQSFHSIIYIIMKMIHIIPPVVLLSLHL